MSQPSKYTDEARPEALSTFRADIKQEWSRFNAEEIAALRDNDDLVVKLSRKYRLDDFQAAQLVEAFAKGRQL